MNNEDNIINNTIEMPQASLDYYRQTSDPATLNAMKNNLINKNDRSEKEEELLNIVNERLEELNNVDIQKTLEETKKSNSNLDNFEILKVPKEYNDKDNYGFRNDSNYLKVKANGKVVVYEIPNNYTQKVQSILSDGESLKDLSEKDIMDKLLPYLSGLEEKSIGVSEELSNDNIIKEIDKINDTETKKAFTSNMDKVIKEAEILRNYVKLNNLQEEQLVRATNSKGERIYIIGDKTIKFLGENLDMYFLNETGMEKANNIEQQEKVENNTPENDTNNLESTNNNIVDISSFENQIEILTGITDKIYGGFDLDEQEIKFFTSFIKAYIEALNNGVNIYAPLTGIYDTFSNSGSFINEEINNMIQNEKQEKEEKGQTLDNNNVKKLVLNDNTNNTGGFAKIIYIIVSIVVFILIVLYFFLVNR